MVIFVVPGSKLVSLIGTTALTPAELQSPGGTATNGREHRAVTQYVMESLSVDALGTLLKRQGDQVLVLHQENNGHRASGDIRAESPDTAQAQADS